MVQRYPIKDDVAREGLPQPTDFPMALLNQLNRIGAARTIEMEIVHIKRLKRMLSHEWDPIFIKSLGKIDGGLLTAKRRAKQRYGSKLTSQIANRIDLDLEYQFSGDLHEEIMRLMSRKNLLGERTLPLVAPKRDACS